MTEELKKSRLLLIADDDADDRFLIRQALHDGGFKNSTQFVSDGEDLIYFLNKAKDVDSNSDDFSMPSLILLDLNMPRLNGREALKVIKNDESLKKIPVVILTTSKNAEDVAGSYKDGASSFLTKPLDYKQLVALMTTLNSYWFEGASLPKTN
jgi:CheY-like chemotaxis protein